MENTKTVDGSKDDGIDTKYVGETKPNSKKRKGEDSDSDEDWSPKKGKRKQDSDDEDWEISKAKKRNSKSEACALCRKKFSSKHGLTMHERMVHKNKLVKNSSPTVDTLKKDNEKSIESLFLQQ